MNKKDSRLRRSRKTRVRIALQRATRLVVKYQPQVLVDEYPAIRFLVEVMKK